MQNIVKKRLNKILPEEIRKMNNSVHIEGQNVLMEEIEKLKKIKS